MVWGGAGVPSYPGNRTWLEAEVAGHLPSIYPHSCLLTKITFHRQQLPRWKDHILASLAAGSDPCSMSDASGWECLQSSRTEGT